MNQSPHHDPTAKTLAAPSLSRRIDRRGLRPVVLSCLPALTLWCWGIDPAGAQDRILIQGPAQVVQVQIANAPTQQTPTQETWSNATFDTNADIDSVLRRAQDYLRDSRYDDAAALLQHVLDQPGQPLTTTDQKLYLPARTAAEQLLATLPPEGLSAYRLLVDGQARALMRQADRGRPRQALEELVTRFFLSALGDDAAYRLACLDLDGGDFTAAARLLGRIDATHPDPSTPRPDLLARLAVAQARSGDTPSARKTLARLRALRQPSTSLPTEALAAWLDALPPGITVSGGAPVWPSDLPDSPLTGQTLFAAIWELSGNLRLPVDKVVPQQMREHYLSQQTIQTRPEITTRWQEGRWLPTAVVAIVSPEPGDSGRSGADPLAILKLHNYRSEVTGNTAPAVVAINARTGRVVWEAEETMASADANQIIYAGHIFSSGAGEKDPITPDEITLFRDKAGKQLRVIGRRLYRLEGQSWLTGLGRQLARFGIQTGQKSTPQKVTLVAHDVLTGKRVWQSRAPEPVREDTDPAPGQDPAAAPVPLDDAIMPSLGPNGRWRFLAPPIACSGLLAAPFEADDALWLAGLDPVTGEPRWHTYLAAAVDDALGAAGQVAMLADGGDLYLSCGSGVLFALDGRGGGIRWVTRYPQTTSEEKRRMMQNFGVRAQRISDDGWDAETLFTHGGTLWLLPSDARRIYGFDPVSGRLSVSHDSGNARQLLGVAGDRLWTADEDSVRMYRLSGNRVTSLWQTQVGGITGRGLVAGDSVYVPTGDSLQRLSAGGGKRLGKAGVISDLPDPIGNLFTDGTTLYSAAMERVYALVPGDQRMELLTRRIEGGDLEALGTRARLRRQLGQYAGAVEDYTALEAAMTGSAATEQDPRQAVRDQLLECLLQLAMQEPAPSTDIWERAVRIADTPARKTLLALTQAADCARRGDIARAAALYLSTASLGSGDLIRGRLDDPELQTRADVSAADGLRDLQASHRQRVLEALEQIGRDTLQTIRRSDKIEELLAIARSFQGTALGTEAVLRSARLAEDAGRPELAEIVLLEGLDPLAAPSPESANRSASEPVERVTPWPDGDPAPRTPAAAGRRNDPSPQLSVPPAPAVHPTAVVRLALARMYERLNWPRQAAPHYASLAQLPTGLRVTLDGQTVSVAEDAANALRRLASNSRTPGPPDPPYKLLWSERSGGQSPVDTSEGPDSQWLDENLLLINLATRRLEMRQMQTGEPRWALTLEFSRSGMHMINGRFQVGDTSFMSFHQMMRSHHVLLSIGERTATAIGLTSGKPLWSIDLDRPNRGYQHRAMRSIRYHGGYPQSSAGGQAAVGRGVLLTLALDQDTAVGLVRAHDLIGGSTLWERRLSREAIDGLRIVGGYAVMLAGGGRRVIVSGLDNGRILGRFSLPEDSINFAQLWQDQGLCVMSNDGTLRRLALPDGRPLWEVKLTAPAYRLIDLGNGSLAALSQDGRLSVLDAGDGRVRYAISRTERLGNIQDVALSSDGVSLAVAGTTSKGEVALGLIDQRTGKLSSLITGGMQGGYQITARSIAHPGDLIPLLSMERGPNNQRWSNQFSVRFFRKSTGRFDDSIRLPIYDRAGKLKPDGKVENPTGPLEIHPGAFVLSSHSLGLQVFGHDPGATRDAPPGKDGERR